MKTDFALTNNTLIYTHVNIMYQATLLDIPSRLLLDPDSIVFFDVKSISFKKKILLGLPINLFYTLRHLNLQVVEDIVRPCKALYYRRKARQNLSLIYKFFCFVRLQIDLIYSYSLFAFCCRYKVFFKLGFSDHGCYSNSGAIEATCVALQKPYYSTSYPYSLNIVRPYPHSSVTTFRKISLPDSFSSLQNICDSNTDINIPYLMANFNSLDNKDQAFVSRVSKTEFIVYAHSFSDAQNFFGFDRVFSNIYEWTYFTLKFLLDKNYFVILKAHPNFWSNISSRIIEYDKEIFRQLISEFSNYQNLFIINEPISNSDLLKILPASVTCITHHGTVASETLACSLKTICSNTHPLHKYFQHSKNYFSWQDLNEYKQLINMLATKESESITRFPNLISYFYSCKGFSYGSETSSSYEIASFFGLSYADYISNPHSSIDNFYKSLSESEKAKLQSIVQSTIIENPNNQNL